MLDFQPIISAILLFQYKRLVSKIVTELDLLDLRNRKVLITSCAFGNVIPRVVKAAVQGGAERVLIADIIPNELLRARANWGSSFGNRFHRRQRRRDERWRLVRGKRRLHPSPHCPRPRAGAGPGPGARTAADREFHRPDPWCFALSWTYFKVFEPLGLAIWDTHDPLHWLENVGGWTCERTTYFFGNFQIITATKH
jgi:hypothetical protein